MMVDFLELTAEGSGRIQTWFTEVFEVKIASINTSAGEIDMYTGQKGVVGEFTFNVEGSGSSCVTADALEMSHLQIEKEGSGDISIGPSGSCQNAQLIASGSGTIDIRGIQCQNVSVDLMSSGNMVVQATGSLSGQVYGGGKLRYAGNAPQSITSFNYMGIVTGIPASSSYRPAQCLAGASSPLSAPVSTSPARYDGQLNVLLVAGTVFVVALVLRWFNESRRRAREEERQPLLGTRLL
ncbi:hypothetical protein P3T76_009108 [Phytophthora citrophthora]|uniref:Putative auto-transporter adhesin head GIN domain-containing protein n=1 Tax=Phytophthora citrophthora TaxID=4793 RepID=A0AAD9GIZ2_9STRA|nr:hypothetical protein P3T76_009108 [Phytophthora citrophthora]